MKAALLSAAVFLPAAVRAQGVSNTHLWEVTKKGSPHTSYLFGTFHEASAAYFNALPHAMARLKAADVLFVEAHGSSNIDGSHLGQTFSWNTEKWRAVLSPRQDSVFATFVAKAEDSIYYRLSPFYLVFALGRLYLSNFCETDTTSGDLMDDHIAKLALSQGKEVRSLDENQQELLQRANTVTSRRDDSIYAVGSVQLMQNMLNNDLSGCDVLNAYKRFERNPDLEKEPAATSVNFVLLAERNSRWLPVLEKAFSRQNCFVAVGARHLFYKYGLVALLKNRGYKVRPVRS